MAYIKLPEGLPGIRGLLAFRPETAEPMSVLVEVLLRGPSTLTQAERELVGAYVSARNDCFYCRTSHGMIAAHLMGGDEQLVEQVTCDPESAPITPKLKALLALAGKVQEGGKAVRPEDVDRARACGATDLEIHDTVLIAAAFCMFNRYVDGLGTEAPEDVASYRERAAGVVRGGYADLAARLARAGSGRGRQS
jgi:uncharacterized peroxidase-related enzyme